MKKRWTAKGRDGTKKAVEYTVDDEGMGSRRRSRYVRLMSILVDLVNSYPDGVTATELSRKYGVCRKQITDRDFRVLDIEFGVQRVACPGHRHAALRECFVFPIALRLPEAMMIFMASWLLASHSNVYNTLIASTFQKLNVVLPESIGDEIKKSLQWLRRQPEDGRFVNILSVLLEAWAEKTCVKIDYQPLNQGRPAERVIEPYFIFPSGLEHATYVMAYCHEKKCVLTFKVERIRRIEQLVRRYEVPADFDIQSRLGNSWGVSGGEEVETIKLKVDKSIARVFQETRWHPSQVTQMQDDGSAITTFKLAPNIQFQGFVLSWGDKVEVIEPSSFKKTIIGVVDNIRYLYKNRN